MTFEDWKRMLKAYVEAEGGKVYLAETELRELFAESLAFDELGDILLEAARRANEG